jgi:hypothetical protein
MKRNLIPHLLFLCLVLFIATSCDKQYVRPCCHCCQETTGVDNTYYDSGTNDDYYYDNYYDDGSNDNNNNNNYDDSTGAPHKIAPRKGIRHKIENNAKPMAAGKTISHP